MVNCSQLRRRTCLDNAKTHGECQWCYGCGWCRSNINFYKCFSNPCSRQDLHRSHNVRYAANSNGAANSENRRPTRATVTGLGPGRGPVPGPGPGNGPVSGYSALDANRNFNAGPQSNHAPRHVNRALEWSGYGNANISNISPVFVQAFIQRYHNVFPQNIKDAQNQVLDFIRVKLMGRPYGSRLNPGYRTLINSWRASMGHSISNHSDYEISEFIKYALLNMLVKQ